MDPRPASFKSSFQECITIIMIMLVQTLSQYGTNISLPMMNALESSFASTTSNDKLWFMAAFPLTSGTFILISGKFGDLYGLKKVLICGSIWSTIWTLVCGLSLYSGNVVFFCICRGMQGIGIAFMLPTAIGIAGHLYQPGERKAMVFSLVGACGPFGAALAAIFGGICAQYDAVAWAFYSVSICFASIGLATWFYIPDIPTHHEEEKSEEKPQMDWMGAILGVIGLVLFNFSWNQAPQAGWANPYIIVLLVLGLIFIIAFVYVEGTVKDPLLPKEVINLRTGLILSIVGLGWGSFSIWVFYYWSMVLNLREYQPVMAGLTYITFMVFGIIACAVVGLFIRRIRPSILLVSASVAFVVGIAMLSGTPVDQSFWKMHFPQMVILSFGMDISFPAASLILSDNLPDRHQGMASSLVSTTINYSMSIALGVGAIAETEVYARAKDTIKSYDAAEYVGVGFAVLSLLLAIALHCLMPLSHDTSDQQSAFADIEALSFSDSKSLRNASDDV